ncbi:HD-like signal output (HDOD) protein [Litorivivens lipolytica]|uniref:HD-like signal output (HDOD) protein n=1 Tax=Litorivivens lipolytica TaxID=1524264 RepID=A0A7W4W4Z4_9GAMM|nr:HDOD domain-containing protein [Litorivivens lipolytica]MBB3047233.1 HD-like signal output (HDOD) protein [Litorivivens lipolytica]
MDAMNTDMPPPGASQRSQAAKSELLGRISAALKDGTIELPSLPDIALEVRSVAAERDLGVPDLVKVIQQDPGLSAYLIKISNSAHYQRAKPASTLLQAISRLGVPNTRDYASSYAIRTLFFMRNPSVKAQLRTIWQRSVYTASVAHVMAGRCNFAPDRALLAGLIQDIGALPIMAQLENYPDLIADPLALKQLLRDFTGKISALILNAWKFDTELVNVGLEREAWLRDKKPEPDLADLILIARYHTYIGQSGGGPLPCLSKMPAFHKLDLGEMEPEEGLAFLKEARAEVEEMRQALV